MNDFDRNDPRQIERKRVLLKAVTDTLNNVNVENDVGRIFDRILEVDFTQFIVPTALGARFLDWNPSQQTSANMSQHNNAKFALPTSSNNLFGGNNNVTGNNNSSLFGGNNNNSLFGGNNNTANNTNNNSLFGSNNNTDNPNNSSLFGSNNNTVNTNISSLFGGNNSGTSNNNASNLFGGSNNNDNTLSNLFGGNNSASTNNNSSNLFDVGNSVKNSTNNDIGNKVDDPYGFGIKYDKKEILKQSSALSSVIVSNDKNENNIENKSANGNNIFGDSSDKNKNENNIFGDSSDKNKNENNIFGDSFDKNKNGNNIFGDSSNKNGNENNIFGDSSNKNGNENNIFGDSSDKNKNENNIFDGTNENILKNTNKSTPKKDDETNKTKPLKNFFDDLDNEDKDIINKIQNQDNSTNSNTKNTVNENLPQKENIKEKYERNLSFPIFTRKNYWTKPINLENLDSSITLEELQHVENFEIGNEFGTIRWKGAVDCSNVNFDKLVKINKTSVEVYPNDDEKPPKGDELNKPAVITFFDVGRPKNINEVKVQQKFKQFLNKQILENNKEAEFISWDLDSNKTVFEVKHFTKYALNIDDFDESEKDFDESESSDFFFNKSGKNTALCKSKLKRFSFSRSGDLVGFKERRILLQKNFLEKKEEFNVN
ncbi:Nuclear pore complex protein Nup98-Nup96 [Bonamia ostreae]|uniref:Nuclear pore complex protein Nup98-Nup96 n=1 Tax=Bonamia ostreae TaxID=126728 RepID=A0ABV2AGU5_9EUKA